MGYRRGLVSIHDNLYALSDIFIKWYVIVHRSGILPEQYIMLLSVFASSSAADKQAKDSIDVVFGETTTASMSSKRTELILIENPKNG